LQLKEVEEVARYEQQYECSTGRLCTGQKDTAFMVPSLPPVDTQPTCTKFSLHEAGERDVENMRTDMESITDIHIPPATT